MSHTSAILITLIVYKLLLLGIGFWASKRTQSAEDFFIGGKGLGPWVSAISACASASSAWSLLGMSGAAWAMGLSVVWLFPAVIGGYLFNWLYLAPRLRHLGNQTGAISVTDLLSGKGHWKMPIAVLCSFAIVFSFAFYIASQLQAAGTTFASTFEMPASEAIILGTGIILIYTLLGGFWAVAVTDTLQGLLMAAVAVALPATALWVIGGPVALFEQLSQLLTPEQLSLTGGRTGDLALAFVVGMLAVGLGNPGQPHVVNRFMAVRDEKSLRQASIIGLIWPVIVYGGMMVVGWCARVLLPPELATGNEGVLFVLTQQLFAPVLAGIVVAASLSAIMSTADSQLLSAGSALSHDIGLGKQHALLISRLTVAVMCLVSMLLAIYAPAAIFSRVLFAWAALGSAFGPLLIVLASGRSVPGLWRFAAVAAGFGLTLIFNWFTQSTSSWLERLIPFVVALLLAYMGSVLAKRATAVSELAHES